MKETGTFALIAMYLQSNTQLGRLIKYRKTDRGLSYFVETQKELGKKTTNRDTCHLAMTKASVNVAPEWGAAQTSTSLQGKDVTVEGTTSVHNDQTTAWQCVHVPPPRRAIGNGFIISSEKGVTPPGEHTPSQV